MVIHEFGGAFHNLKKFFAFGRKKYTLFVYKELSWNILLSKKENINNGKKNPLRYQGINHFL